MRAFGLEAGAERILEDFAHAYMLYDVYVSCVVVFALF